MTAPLPASGAWLLGPTVGTHVNVEGESVADGPARVDSGRQLGLPVGAVIKQRPRRQLPVVQRGGNPKV